MIGLRNVIIMFHEHAANLIDPILITGDMAQH